MPRHMVTAKTATIFVTADGREFLKEEAARKWEFSGWMLQLLRNGGVHPSAGYTAIEFALSLRDRPKEWREEFVKIVMSADAQDC